MRRMLALAPLLLLAGCTQRQLSITSDPPGAVVTVNDVEVGRTPVTAAFRYYGRFDILVEHEGYEPLRTSERAWAPIYEYPPLDMLTVLWPFPISSTSEMHFKLQPEMSTVQPKEELEKGLLERAAALRGKVTE